MNKVWDILGIGCVAVDDILIVDRYPQPDEKMLIKDMQRHGGGLTATALVTAARQGARTAYCGRLGEDDLSLFSIRAMESEGVDCSLTQRDPAARPYHSIIIIERTGGSRTILYSGEGVIETSQEWITPEMIGSSRLLYVDYHFVHAAIHAARIAHQLGIPVVADVELAQIPDVDELISLVDHLIIGEELGRRLAGKDHPADIVVALAKAPRQNTVVTAGANGCWFAERGGPVIHFPAFPVDVVDTTGCGDVFHGAYAASLARGEAVPTAIAVATASAGIKATVPGGRTGIPDLPTLKAFLE
jgi:sugar/nucleoside kinase (ribokinase family)